MYIENTCTLAILQIQKEYHRFFGISNELNGVKGKQATESGNQSQFIAKAQAARPRTSDLSDSLGFIL
jgi:hypothetical protein